MVALSTPRSKSILKPELTTELVETVKEERGYAEAPVASPATGQTHHQRTEVELEDAITSLPGAWKVAGPVAMREPMRVN